MKLRLPRALAFGALFAAVLAGLSLSAAAQTNRQAEFPFAAGAGGFAVTDTGRPADVKAFSTGGFRVYADVQLEPGVILQARYDNFLLPGSEVTVPAFQPASGSPRVKVNGGSLSVGYMFREAWWQAGLIAGVGVYGLKPRDPEAGQVPADISETVIGWHAGLLTIFQLGRRWDFRIDATGYLLRTDASHKPVLVGASLAYHF
ncbi:MAG: hypothetical protein NEA02_07690 [Thermoanaerobaculia bacterium]|nr:hypothetical protein [Thermoanaerobaculia bacterium]